MVGKSLNTESPIKDILLRNKPEDKLFRSKLLSFSREIRFSDEEFVTDIFISNIKYNQQRFEIDNTF